MMGTNPGIQQRGHLAVSLKMRIFAQKGFHLPLKAIPLIMRLPFVITGEKGLVTILSRFEKKHRGQEIKRSKDFDYIAKIQLSGAPSP